MAEHIRYARNRRELLTDCFCGTGSLAFTSMMAQEQARAAAADSTDRAAIGYLGCALARLNRTVEAAKFRNRAGNGAWTACAQPARTVPSPPPF